MKIALIPIDNRPVCYNLPQEIAAIDKNIELLVPPREFLGGLHKEANVENLLNWLKALTDIDCLILSLDTITYGGLIPSRRSTESLDEIKNRLSILKEILTGKKVLAFSSIMRISNNNYNEEEKEYWKDYGKKIFEYSYSFHKNSHKLEEIQKVTSDTVPQKILEDYITTRKRNFEINKIYLQWQKEGIFDTLIFSKDDCAEYGINVLEAKELEVLGGKIKTGADEIPLTLLARAIDKKMKIYIDFIEPDFKNCISNYEDISIEKSIIGQLELAQIDYTSKKSEADLILVINNFINKQGELVMGWDTLAYNKTFIPPEKPYAIADVRFANGADNNFIEELLKKINIANFYGYAGWNTSANTIGSLLACIKVKFNAAIYCQENFYKLQMIRFLDDWAYQANVRKKITELKDIKKDMIPYEEKLKKIFNFNENFKYSYPWNRKFEVEINIT